MIKLNLPEFDYNIRKAEGKIWIFDVIRKKFVILTPEEWVRQHFLNYIINELRYPKTLIKIESGLRYNKLQKRSDIVVFNREGSPWMVIECKSPNVKLSWETMQQASVYNTTLKAKYLTITNGLTHFWCEILWEEKRSLLLEDVPQYL